MIGIYFSGTGNSRHALEVFLRNYDSGARAYSIEDPRAPERIKGDRDIAFCYPVQYSDIPKILKDFVDRNARLWKGKNVFVIATMAMFSGDGAGVLARRLRRYGARNKEQQKPPFH